MNLQTRDVDLARRFHRRPTVIDLDLQLHRFTHNDFRARQHCRNFRRITTCKLRDRTCQQNREQDSSERLHQTSTPNIKRLITSRYRHDAPACVHPAVPALPRPSLPAIIAQLAAGSSPPYPSPLPPPLPPLAARPSALPL